MNCFSHLDSLYRAEYGDEFGEVVSVSVYLRKDNTSEMTCISWKRKNCTAPASTNAWHLHRGLCAEFRHASVVDNVHVTRSLRRIIYRSLRALVAWSYEENCRTRNQHFVSYLDYETGDWEIPS